MYDRVKGMLRFWKKGQTDGPSQGRNRWRGSSLVRLMVAWLWLPAFAQAQFTPTTSADTRTRENAIAATSSQFGWGYGSGWSDTRLQPTANTQNWTLGVFVENTDRGALIAQVQNGSAAALAGLEAGDLIINVSGFQVGYVEGRLYDVGDEIRRRIDAQGRVSLLVQDRRTAQVQPLLINMQPTSLTITGEVVYRDRQALPNNAVLQVQLVNVTRPYASIRGGTLLVPVTRSQPFPFELHLDPQYITAGDRYQLQASISVGNQTMYVTPQPISLDLNGSVPYQRLEVVSASTGQPSNNYAVGYPPNSQAIVDYYRRYLGRDPSAREIAAWTDHVARGRSINDLPVMLLSSQEFYERIGGNDLRFLEQMFQMTAGRAPDASERGRWLQQLQANGGSRVALVRDFFAASGIR